MGLDNAGITLLSAAKSVGVDFSQTATIGRQSFFPSARELRRVFSLLKVDEDASKFIKGNPFGEKFFEFLGARTTESVDFSNYEGASTIHDMNLAVPDSMKEKFSVVFDGGSLEHIFNTSQSFKNCMEMVEVGGHFIQVTPANNFLGHGFWQFSPELIFRIFSDSNGFKVRAVLLCEMGRKRKWVLVSDPDNMKTRVELRNHHPVYLCTIAQRIKQKEIFATTPQQSDYSAVWSNFESPQEVPVVAPSVKIRIINALGYRFLPLSWKTKIRAFLAARAASKPQFSFKQKCYQLISEQDLMLGKF